MISCILVVREEVLNKGLIVISIIDYHNCVDERGDKVEYVEDVDGLEEADHLPIIQMYIHNNIKEIRAHYAWIIVVLAISEDKEV